MSCCESNTSHTGKNHKKKKIDYVFYASLILVAIFYLTDIFFKSQIQGIEWLSEMAKMSRMVLDSTWWGVISGAIFAGILSKIPREFVIHFLGKKGTFKGILRAVGAGVLLDLCNHGILVVATKLYERGASIGQVVAFLVASPWNSFSLTLILIGLIGVKLTIAFIVFSMVIALITGFIFEILVAKKILPENHYTVTIPEDFKAMEEAKKRFKSTSFDAKFFKEAIFSGIKDSKIVLKWLLIGILIAGLLRVVLNPEQFGTFFGPSIVGLAITIIFATVLEVCSEGSTPIAADIINNAKSPGNGFAFLMAGASTDYTEIMILKETTKSWKIPLFLPLITLPQIIAISVLLNVY